MLLEQLREVFGEAGALKMETLAFWQTTPTLVREAEMLAIKIDTVFREIRGAESEDGITQSLAINPWPSNRRLTYL